jgi:hypothetical protein
VGKSILQFSRIGGGCQRVFNPRGFVLPRNHRNSDSARGPCYLTSAHPQLRRNSLNTIIYIVGLVVIIGAVLGYFGLR